MILLILFVLSGCKQKEVSNVQEKNKLVISVKDMTPPAIKIKEPVRIKIGTSDFDIRDYFTATDNDGMEPSCSVEGSVSVKKAGKYDIDIRCKDKDRNASNKSVEVIVEDEKKDVPVTGTNPNKETEKSKETTKPNNNSNVPPVQAPPAVNPYHGKKYLYADGYNQLTASSQCNADLLASGASGSCVILYGDDGIDIGLMLQ